MATLGTFYVRGIAQWAKVFEHNRDYGYEDAFKKFYGAYTIELVVDDENLEKYESSGAAGVPAPAYWDEDNQVYTKKRTNKDGKKTKKTDLHIIKFKRKHIDPVGVDLGGAPKLVDMPEDAGAIGNGSDVEVKFTVYTTKMSNGSRLEGIKIHNLVKYEPKVADEQENGGEGDELPF